MYITQTTVEVREKEKCRNVESVACKRMATSDPSHHTAGLNSLMRIHAHSKTHEQISCSIVKIFIA